MPRAPFIKHLSQISVTKPEPAPEKLSYLNQDRKIINSKKKKTSEYKVLLQIFVVLLLLLCRPSHRPSRLL